MKIIILSLMVVLLAGCSAPPAQKVIDASSTLQECIVYSNKIECRLDDNNIYVVDMLRIGAVTRYDESAWTENTAYCPNSMLEGNYTIDKCRNATTKMCYNGTGWNGC